MRGESPTHRVTSPRLETTLLDRLVVGYVLVFCLGLVVLGRDDPVWLGRLGVNLGLVAAILAMVRWWGKRTRGVSGFLRQLYPGLLYPFCYWQMQTAVHWLIPSFLDHQVVAFEQTVFGVAPNIWIQSMQLRPLNEWMMAGYFSYYFLIPAVVLPLHFRYRHSEARQLLTATTIAFLISYAGFVLYPVEGPRFFLAGQLGGPLSGWVFVPLVQWIIGGAAIHGGCMPSSHTAVALVVLFYARRTQPRLAIWLAPFVFALIVATFWGRFHYVSDTLIGSIVGLGAIFVVERLSHHEAAPSWRDRRSSGVLSDEIVRAAG